MARNADGDLSAAEFLGTPQLFSRLDANHDRLLTPQESSAASQP